MREALCGNNLKAEHSTVPRLRDAALPARGAYRGVRQVAEHTRNELRSAYFAAKTN
jgi:hypothetical protein